MITQMSRILSREQCLELLHKNQTPQNIIEHCKVVSALATSIAKRLTERGIPVNISLVESASLLHDIEKLKPQHEIAGFELLKKEGFVEIAETMRTHGLSHLDDPHFYPRTIEQKLVFYADKRVAHTTIVSIDERFKDLKVRYSRINEEQFQKEIDVSKSIEKEIESLLRERI